MARSCRIDDGSYEAPSYYHRKDRSSIEITSRDEHTTVRYEIYDVLDEREGNIDTLGRKTHSQEKEMGGGDVPHLHLYDMWHFYWVIQAWMVLSSVEQVHVTAHGIQRHSFSTDDNDNIIRNGLSLL